MILTKSYAPTLISGTAQTQYTVPNGRTLYLRYINLAMITGTWSAGDQVQLQDSALGNIVLDLTFSQQAFAGLIYWPISGGLTLESFSIGGVVIFSFTGDLI